MRFLRTNTAVIITVGPFYDKTDGVTIETGLTISNERITLTADTDAGSAPTNILDNVTGATSGTDNDLNYITGNDAGMMQLELSAANTNRLGRMFLSITDAANHVPVFHEFMVLPAMIYDAFILGTDRFDTNVTHVSDTAQTARDLGASVLLSPGTGAGQLDITSGVVKANLVQILATALTETAGQIAAAFKQFFDVASPTGTMKAITNVVTTTNLTNAATSGDLTATMKTSVETAVDNAVTGNSLVEGINQTLLGLVMERTSIGATGNDATHVHLPTLTYGDDEINDHLLVIYDVSEDEFHARWIEDWANATKLATVATLPFTPEASTDVFRLLSNRRDIDAGWETALTEAYRATGATGTPAQLLYELIAHLGESSISSTTKTLKKLDGSTTAKTYTLDSATTPTSITETT